MSYEIKSLQGPIGLSTDSDPLVFTTGLQVSEMALLNFIFTIDAVSAGITALTPATFLCEHSWDGGATWSTIPGMVLEDIDAAGVFRAYVSNTTGLIAPNVRVSIVCPAGEEVMIGKAQRTHVSPRDTSFLQPPAIVGGIATEATQLLIQASVANIESDVGLIQGDVDLIQTSVQNIETSVGNIETDVDTINTSVGNIESDVGLIQTDVATIQTDVDTIKTSVGNIETSVGNIETDVDAIRTAVESPVGVERTVANAPYVRDYSVANISDAAWTEIVASTSAEIRKMHIFDSSGVQVRLATGAAGFETEIWRIEPGGPGPVEINLPAGTRLSVRAASGTINDGDLVINFLS